MSDSASFERDPRSAKQARRFVTDRLQGHDSTLVGDVVLMASELVTNSILHSTGELTLTVEIAARTIRVAVSDAGPGRPSVQRPQPDEPTGRGLQLVAKLADEWGTSPDNDGGNTVWFTVAVDPELRRNRTSDGAALPTEPTRPTTPSGTRPNHPARASRDGHPPPSMPLNRNRSARPFGLIRRCPHPGSHREPCRRQRDSPDRRDQTLAALARFPRTHRMPNHRTATARRS
jgi:anti-sigma regulatory factor (Ser/Thr protein kinase)